MYKTHCYHWKCYLVIKCLKKDRKWKHFSAIYNIVIITAPSPLRNHFKKWCVAQNAFPWWANRTQARLQTVNGQDGAKEVKVAKRSEFLAYFPTPMCIFFINHMLRFYQIRLCEVFWWDHAFLCIDYAFLMYFMHKEQLLCFNLACTTDQSCFVFTQLVLSLLCSIELTEHVCQNSVIIHSYWWAEENKGKHDLMAPSGA